MDDADRLPHPGPSGDGDGQAGRASPAAPLGFIGDLRFEALPERVVRQARLALLDLIGVAVAGSRTRLSQIVRNFAASELLSAEIGARILFDGRRVGAAGAALAGASTIDSFDAHDGHRLTKGHAGVALLPGLAAMVDAGRPVDSREFVTCLVLGYEVATRAGIALHDSVSDYHTSGAWNSIGVAAMGARLADLDVSTIRHALGIAEYHGPRSQMMRCIDHPDHAEGRGGLGALSPACRPSHSHDTALPARRRSRWKTSATPGSGRALAIGGTIEELYFKPYPVCRWAQPAVEAVAELLAAYAHRPRKRSRRSRSRPSPPASASA